MDVAGDDFRRCLRQDPVLHPEGQLINDGAVLRPAAAAVAEVPKGVDDLLVLVDLPGLEHVGVVAQHQVRAVVDEPLGGPDPPGLRGVDALRAAVVEDHLKVGFLLRRLEALDNGPGLGLGPEAVADDGDAIAVFLQVEGPVVAAVLQPGGGDGLHRVLVARRAVVPRVVVGQGHGLHAGGGEDLRVGRGGPEPVGGVRALLLGSESPVRQHILQVHHGEVVGLEDGPDVLEEVFRLLLGGLVQEIPLCPLSVEGGQQHVSGEADDDAEGVLRLPGPGHGPVELRQVRLPQQGVVGVRGIPLRRGDRDGADQQQDRQQGGQTALHRLPLLFRHEACCLYSNRLFVKRKGGSGEDFPKIAVIATYPFTHGANGQTVISRYKNKAVWDNTLYCPTRFLIFLSYLSYYTSWF